MKHVSTGIPRNLNIFPFQMGLTQNLAPKEKYCSVNNPFVYERNKMTAMHATLSQFYSVLSFFFNLLGHYNVLDVICEVSGEASSQIIHRKRLSNRYQ
jgi:hypothetical protein